MDYITIVAPTYEDAVRKARDQYGDRLRIHSRKDVVSKGFLGIRKSKHCELTCYVAGGLGQSGSMSGQDAVSDGGDHAGVYSMPGFSSSRELDDDGIEEADIRRFELEAKTPDPVSGKYRESDLRPEPDPSLDAPFLGGGDGAGRENGTMEGGSVDSRHDEHSNVSDGSRPEAVPDADGVAEPSNSYAAPTDGCGISDADVRGGIKPLDNGQCELDALIDYARRLLYGNDFSTDYIEWIVRDLRKQLEPALPSIPSLDEFELLVVDRIVGSVEVDHNSQLHPPRLFVLVGPTGVGKTTTIAKIAAVYGTLPPEGIRRKVGIITMDSFRVGAYEQMESFGQALGVPVYRADDESGFYEALEKTQDFELVLVDTFGRSPKDGDLDVKMKTMLNVPDKGNMKCYLTVSASMKKGDLDGVFDQFLGFGICSVIVTKTDETQTIGNILSICHSRSLPLLFVTDGQKVPRDIHKASSAFMLSLLKGFNMDFNALWNTQIGSDE